MVFLGLVAPVFVWPEPTFGVGMNARLQRIPTFLGQFRGVGFGRTFNRCVLNHTIATVRQGVAFEGSDDRAGALGECDMGRSHAGHQAAKSGDRNGALAWVDIQVDQHSKFSAGLEVFKHFQHGAFLGDDGAPGAGAELIKNRAEEFVFEILGNYRASRDRVGADERNPLEI